MELIREQWRSAGRDDKWALADRGQLAPSLWHLAEPMSVSTLSKISVHQRTRDYGPLNEEALAQPVTVLWAPYMGKAIIGDGNHRVAKAAQEGRKTLLAVIVVASDFVGSGGRPFVEKVPVNHYGPQAFPEDSAWSPSDVPGLVRTASMHTADQAWYHEIESRYRYSEGLIGASPVPREELDELLVQIMTHYQIPLAENSYTWPNPSGDSRTSMIGWDTEIGLTPVVFLGSEMQDQLTVCHEAAHLVDSYRSGWWGKPRDDTATAHGSEWAKLFIEILARYYPKAYSYMRSGFKEHLGARGRITESHSDWRSLIGQKTEAAVDDDDWTMVDKAIPLKEIAYSRELDLRDYAQLGAVDVSCLSCGQPCGIGEGDHAESSSDTEMNFPLFKGKHGETFCESCVFTYETDHPGVRVVM